MLLDPNTGALLAMASLPTFDPNHFSDSSRERWRNRAVMDAFEPAIGQDQHMVPLPNRGGHLGHDGLGIR